MFSQPIALLVQPFLLNSHVCVTVTAAEESYLHLLLRLLLSMLCSAAVQEEEKQG
jgi:hypothetical protein